MRVKRLARFTTLLLAVLAWVVPKANAQERFFEEDGIRYEITDKNEKEVQVVAKHPAYSRSIKIPAQTKNGYKVVAIGRQAFMSTTITSIEIAAGVKRIEDEALSSCTNLTKVTLGEGLEEIGGWAFNYLPKLRELSELPASLRTIGPSFLSSKNEIREIKVAAASTHLMAKDGVLFSKDGTELVCYPYAKVGTTYTIPDEVIKVRLYAFNGNGKLQEIITGDKLQELEDGVFNGHQALKKVKLGKGVERIGNLVFPGGDDNGRFQCELEVAADNPYLKMQDGALLSKDGTRLIAYINRKDRGEYKVPEGVVRIQTLAFERCNFSDLALPKSLEELPQEWASTLPRLKSVTVDEQNTTLKAVDGVLFSRDGRKLYLYPTAKEGNEYTVPAGVEEIGQRAFTKNKRLQKVVMPSSLERVEYYAFAESVKLKTVEFNEGLKLIGQGAFANCKNLEVGDLPGKLEEIGEEAFRGMERTTSIVIPRTVEYVKKWAFSYSKRLKAVIFLGTKSISEVDNGLVEGCEDLEAVYCFGEKPLPLKGSLGNGSGLKGLYVPFQHINAYKTDPALSQYEAIIQDIHLKTTPELLKLAVGETKPLVGEKTHKVLMDRLGVEWTIDNPNAELTLIPDTPSKVEVTGKSNGEAKVYYQLKGTEKEIKHSSKVIVGNPGAPKPEPTSIKVTVDKNEIKVDETAQCKAEVLPAGADQNVKWSSEKEDIATVDENTGVVTAKKAGTVKIIATSKVKASVTGEVELTVKPKAPVAPEPTGIKVTVDKAEIMVDETAQCTAEVEPAGADQSVEWKSENEEIATVDENGKVTAKKEGKVKITATSKVKNDVKGEVELTIKPKAPVAPEPTGIKVMVDKPEIMVDETAQCSATVEPTGADQSVTWTSEDEEIATVDENGKVTPKKEGKVKITATSKVKNDVKGEVELTIKPKAGATPPPTGVIIAKKGETDELTTLEMTVTGVQELVAIVAPQGADQTVTWAKEDDPSNAIELDLTSGKVTAKKATTAPVKVTATTKDGSHKAELTVTVKPEVMATGVQIALKAEPKVPKTELTIVKGGSEELVPLFTPENTSNKTVTWASSDETSVSVTTEGKIQGLKETTSPVTITVKTTNGKEAELRVTVVVQPVSVLIAKKGENTQLADQTLKVNDELELVAIVEPADADQTVTWSVDPATGVIELENGASPNERKVKAIAANATAATIKVKTVNGIEATLRVTVDGTGSGPAPNVEVTGVKIAEESAPTVAITEKEIYEDQKLQLLAIIEPDNATDKSVTWESADKDFVTVENGMLTGVKVTTAPVTVTVKTINGKTATLAVTVKERPAPESVIIVLNKTTDPLPELELFTTDRTELLAIVKPDEADQRVTWSQEGQAGVLELDNGRIEAKKASDEPVIVKVTTLKGSLTAAVKVTVKENPNAPKPQDPNAKDPKDPNAGNSGEKVNPNLSLPVSTVGAKAYSLWPNPASSWVRVKGLERDTQVGIFNLLGVKVAELPLPVSGELDLGFLPRGRYILMVDGVSLRLVKE